MLLFTLLDRFLLVGDNDLFGVFHLCGLIVLHCTLHKGSHNEVSLCDADAVLAKNNVNGGA